MASNLQARVHLRDALEHLHLIEVHFMLHPQLISYIHTSVIANRNPWYDKMSFLLGRYIAGYTIGNLV